MKINIVIIGDEILLGQVTDINTAEIAHQTAPQGWSIGRVVTVGDNASDIENAIKEALTDADIVMTTGGLGPTKDDITKEVFCRLTGGKLYEDADALANVTTVMSARNLEVNALTRSQAMIPDTCRPIPNSCGTAPGMWFDMEDDKKVIIAMPGVPFETAAMLSKSVIPMLAEHFTPTEVNEHRTVLLTDIPESAVAERLAEWEDNLPECAHLAYLPNSGYLRLRLDVRLSDADKASSLADRLHQELMEKTADHYFDNRDLTPAQILLDLLTRNGLTVATAESCTGGNIAHQLTLIPGSSQAVKGGVVAYCNSIKERALGVSSTTLERYGAVSEPTVHEMSAGVQQLMQTSVTIATSGIAGPTGAVEGKPVGTVCIGIALPDGTVNTTTCHFPGNRRRVIERSTNTALILSVKYLRQFLAR